jgi:hypothetical protein
VTTTKTIYKFVFPAHAGVFPEAICPGLLLLSLPRARGGVSVLGYQGVYDELSSPRTRGCFLHYQENGGDAGVFPAHAGVFLLGVALATEKASLPRARGGVSDIEDWMDEHL